MSNTTRIKDLLQTSTIADDTVLAVDGSSGTKNIKFSDFYSLIMNKSSKYNMGDRTILTAINELYSDYQNLAARYTIADNAGAHNSMFRGKSLGSSFTTEMATSIKNGTFKDIFVGDYFTINSVIYRVAGCNILDKSIYGNNLCLVPDAIMGSAKMNNSNITTGGYSGSVMKSTNLSSATSKITSAFNSSHLISYTDKLTSTVTNGVVTAAISKTCTVELMSESMIFGRNIWGTSGHESGRINSQLPLFRLAPEYIYIKNNYWLRNIVDAEKFAKVSSDGFAANDNASTALGIRPFFFIK